MKTVIDILSADFFSFLQKLYPHTAFSNTTHAFSINTDDKKKEFGDINSNVALVLAKQHKKNPVIVAQEIKDRFQHLYAEKIEVMGAGFLNFFLSKEALNALVKELFLHKEQFFKNYHEKKKKINIEFVSANPTGPLHFGHGRGGIIGDTLSRIFSFLGHEVTKEFYINDAGTQIQKLGESFKSRCLQQLGIPAAVPEDGYHGDYLIELAQTCVKKEKKIEERSNSFFEQYAQNHLLAQIKSTLADYRISFDTWFSEKTLHKNGDIKTVLTELKEKGLLYYQDDAWWFASTKFADDKDRVVERSNGELTYIAADIAYLNNKLSRKFDLLIMILGHDHHGYVRRLYASLNALGYQSHFLNVILYQLVKITKEGALVRMSKRAGNIVSLQDIIDTVSPDVARFFYLYKKADSQLEFDLELALKKTEENPVFYIQYAYVRAQNVLKKSLEHNEFSNIKESDVMELDFAEQLLLRKLISIKYLLTDIIHNSHTHLLAQIAVDVAAEFHHFYAKHHILDTSEKVRSRHRLVITKIVHDTLSLLFDLLGISKPEKM